MRLFGNQLQFEEIRKYTNNFSKENFITKFQFGTLYRGTNGDHKFTVKLWDTDDRQLATCQLEEEVFLYDYSKQRVIVKGVPKTISYCNDELHPPAIVYDLNPLDTLNNLIPQDTFLWADRIKVALGFALSLESFHPNIHTYRIRNIDAAHIMCDQEYTPILYDFSLLSGGIWGMKGMYGDYIGSYGYTDPYYTNEGICSEKGDVFAYGVVLLGLISKRVFNAEKDKEWDFVNKWAEKEYERKRTRRVRRPSLVDKGLSSHPYFYPEDGPIITNLAMRCIKYDPDQRPEMKEVVRTLERLRVVRDHGNKIGVETMLEALTKYSRLRFQERT